MGCGPSAPAVKSDNFTDLDKQDPVDAVTPYLPRKGPLSPKQYRSRLVATDGVSTVQLPLSGYTISYAVVSLRGLYPDSPAKRNQDAFNFKIAINGDPEQHFFGVYDGHGEYGTECSTFARDQVSLRTCFGPAAARSAALRWHVGRAACGCASGPRPAVGGGGRSRGTQQGTLPLPPHCRPCPLPHLSPSHNFCGQVGTEPSVP